MNQDIFKQYKTVVDFLGETLFPDYEIVLYDLENNKNEIVAISNGNISGRKIGDTISPESLALLQQKTYDVQEYSINYPGPAKGISVLRTSSMYIKDDDNNLVGLLCINFDDRRFIELHDHILSVAHPINFLKTYTYHTLQNMEMFDKPNVVEPVSKETSPSIFDLMCELYSSTVKSMNIPMDRLTQEEKISIVSKLQEQGFFELKGAVPYAAKQLRCSNASVYRYLNDLKNR